MPQTRLWHVTSFYRFLDLGGEVEAHRSALEAFMAEHQILGLVIVAPEGINGTVAGDKPEIEALKGFLNDHFETSLRFKDSESEVPPFRRLSVVERNEIVGMKRPDVVPQTEEDNHLSPSEWHDFLTSGKPHVLIDTRNGYETVVGKFKGAIDPQIPHFSHWGAYVDQNPLPKDLPVLIYCTGGIRCEKVMVDLHARGFENIFQLRDGILGYLAEYPEGQFEGECFVFDERVAVNAQLEPTTRFGICPACGLPSDNHRTCIRCEGDYVVCPTCEQGWEPVCSKTCLDRYRRHGAPE